MKKLLIGFLIVIFGIYTWGKLTGNLLYFGKTTLANHSISSVTVFGDFRASKMTINKLDVYGHSEIDATKIGQSLSVKGPLRVYGSQIEGSVEVEGPFDIIDSKIEGFTKVNGDLIASNTQFNSYVDITSKKIKLSGVTIDGNLIVNSLKSEQVLELEHGTVIKGSVTFKSGVGMIIKDGDSKIEGKIEGIEFKQKDF